MILGDSRFNSGKDNDVSKTSYRSAVEYYKESYR